MSDEREWFEPVSVPVGGEVTWQDGQLRLCLDQITLRGEEPSRRLPGLLGKRPGAPVAGICSLAVRLATPWRPLFSYGSLSGFPAAFPMVYGPFDEDAPVLAHRRGAVFEVTTILDAGRAAVVRAGRTRSAPDVEVHGAVSALPAAAQRFVGWWLSLPSAEAWAGSQLGPLPYPAIPGYGMQLSPLSSGSLAVSFHRDEDRYYVRTHGGCFVAEERWHGPFIEREGRFGRPAQPAATPAR